MDRQVAVAVVSASTPGVQRQTKPLLHWTCSFVSAGMPARLPLHELVGYIHLFGVNLRSRVEQIDVLLYEVKGVHIELRGKIVEGTHRDQAHLRMIWSTPRPRRTDVVPHIDVLLLLVRNFPDVRHRQRSAASWSSR